jgi:MoxR-like ATPase
VQQLYVDPAIIEYAVRLVTSTRLLGLAGLDEMKRYLTYGASPRASIALVVGGRALAFLRGRGYVLPYDVSELAADVLRHRVVLSYEALADDVSADDIIARVLDAVPEPEIVLQSR